ncbi:MAG: hypothetical protein NTY35_17875 [Planctomycetota bacterium]|nr:hypothetical protein [Planctomycetota bacterium]
MVVLLRIAAALSGILALALVGLFAAAHARFHRLAISPDVAGPTFQMEAGAMGTWNPVWTPEPLNARSAELRLETDPAWTDPESLAIVIVAESLGDHLATSHGGEWMGSPSEWMDSGKGILPIESSLAPVEDRGHGLPLCLDGHAPSRVSWTVVHADREIAGAEARLVLAGNPWAEERRAKSRTMLNVVLVPSIVLFTYLAVLAARSSRRRAELRRAVKPNAEESID